MDASNIGQVSFFWRAHLIQSFLFKDTPARNNIRQRYKAGHHLSRAGCFQNVHQILVFWRTHLINSYQVKHPSVRNNIRQSTKSDQTIFSARQSLLLNSHSWSSKSDQSSILGTESTFLRYSKSGWGSFVKASPFFSAFVLGDGDFFEEMGNGWDSITPFTLSSLLFNLRLLGDTPCLSEVKRIGVWQGSNFLPFSTDGWGLGLGNFMGLTSVPARQFQQGSITC